MFVLCVVFVLTSLVQPAFFPIICFPHPLPLHTILLQNVSSVVQRGENLSRNILSWLCLLSADRSSLVSHPSIFLLLTASEEETRGFSSVEQQELISGSQQPQTGAALCFFFFTPPTLWSAHNLFSCLNTAWGRPKQRAAYTEPHDL